MQHLTL